MSTNASPSLSKSDSERDVPGSISTKEKAAGLTTTALSSDPTSSSVPLLPSGAVVDAKNTLQDISMKQGFKAIPGVAAVAHHDYPAEDSYPSQNATSGRPVIDAKNTLRSFPMPSPRGDIVTTGYATTTTSSSIPSSTQLQFEIHQTAHTVEAFAVPPETVYDALPATSSSESYVARLHQEQTRIKCVLVALVTLLVVGGAVVGGVCGSGACNPTTMDTSRSSPENPMTTNAPSIAPVPTNVPTPNRADGIVSFINNITLSGKTISYPPILDENAQATSSEDAALQWLIDTDNAVDTNTRALLSAATGSGRFRLQQRFALLTIFFSTMGNGWKINTGWRSESHECGWYGVTCVDMDFGDNIGIQRALTGLNMRENNLVGTIPADLELLNTLETFQAPYNQCQGALSESLGRLSRMAIFDVGINAIVGTLPTSIGQWTNLDFFSVAVNRMTGRIPESIGNWRNLTYGSFDHNSFTGTIPDSLGQWTNLEFVNLSHNRLTGNIPASVENWSQLRMCNFDINDLTGTFPSGLCEQQLPNLTALTVDCNITNCNCCSGCVP